MSGFIRNSNGKLSEALIRIIGSKQSNHFNKSREITFSDVERTNYLRSFNEIQTAVNF